jgi:hypothetical protein
MERLLPDNQKAALRTAVHHSQPHHARQAPEEFMVEIHHAAGADFGMIMCGAEAATADIEQVSIDYGVVAF